MKSSNYSGKLKTKMKKSINSDNSVAVDHAVVVVTKS